MTDLKQPLADLVEDVPRYVVPGDLAASAWAAGRRRRRLRRTAVAGALLAVVGLATPVVPTVSDHLPSTPADTRSATVVDGYPQRVAKQWWVPELPDAPGPVAAVMRRAVRGSQGADTAVAVAQDGRQWRIPSGKYVGEYATLSSTGRYLGYFLEDRPPFVIHDLASGELLRFPRVKPHGPGVDRWMVHMQTPAFWAPDDSRVLLMAIGGRVGTYMLLGTDGSARNVRFDGWAAGWVDDGHIAWLPRSRPKGRPVTVVVTDLTGATVREIVLDLPRRFDRTSLSQWSASVSPDGTQVALADEESFSWRVHRFSMEDGSRLAEAVYVPDANDTCPMSWAGGLPVAPTYTEGGAGQVAVLLDGEAETFVAAQPGLDVSCFALASSAAAGEPQGFFGTSTATWTWWWEETLLALVGGLGLWWLLRLRRSRRGRTPARTGPP